jgi:hypothetical protein
MVWSHNAEHVLTDVQYNQKDLHELRDQLLQIKSTMKDGGLPDEQGELKGGQHLVVPLLERCLKFTEIVEQKYEFHSLLDTPLTYR